MVFSQAARQVFCRLNGMLAGFLPSQKPLRTAGKLHLKHRYGTKFDLMVKRILIKF
jgi:hypothetical protein